MILKIEQINKETYWCCPHCGTALMSDTANSSRTASGTYVFSYGDTIDADISSHTIFTDHNFLSSLNFGECHECSERFSSINIVFMNSKFPEAISYVMLTKAMGKQTNFLIRKKERIAQSNTYENFEYFSLNTFDTPLGTLYDMTLCILPLMQNEVDDDDDSDGWEASINIVEEFLHNHHDLINTLCHGISENNRGSYLL